MGFWEKMWAWLKAFGSNVLEFLEPFGKLLAKSGGDLLLAIALNAVTTMAGTNMTNAEKREAAVKKIAEDAKAKGIEAGENVIRAVLELALAKLKEAQ